MISLFEKGAFLDCGKLINCADPKEQLPQISIEEAKKNTIAYSILQAHNKSGDEDKLRLCFDALTSHDITYVGIIQTARASGLDSFPIPYVLTNCHNSLCAVGGTINEDDHLFGLSAAKKYGGIYVPAHLAVIHQYMREMMAGCGKMILGSDSHTRYGALGTIAIGEGGGELAKQILQKTYDVSYPEVVAVYLTGKVSPFVGPQDVALAIISKVFASGFVKNKVMEFVGDGIDNLNMDFRNGIDVMTTETTCLTSIWKTDSKVEEYLSMHGRKNDYKPLSPKGIAYYDGAIVVELDKIRPMIALPFHPSNAFTIKELKENAADILNAVDKDVLERFPKVSFSLADKLVNGEIYVEQGVIAGCAGGTYDNIIDAADIMGNASIGNDSFALSVYPSSQSVFMELVKNGTIAKLMQSGATIRSAFCGPCFGAGDTPANNTLSIRHTTRNFPNREGSKPASGQLSAVALMDARSIAATAANKGILKGADECDFNLTKPKYSFDESIYQNRVYFGFGKPDNNEQLCFGPNITDWPKMSGLTEDIIIKVVSEIHDEVTTTDELIPSGETSSYRSNPLMLAEFTLSRTDTKYVERAKEVKAYESTRLEGGLPCSDELDLIYEKASKIKAFDKANTGIGSAIFARKPGDGSAREQAASCQKVLGGWANIAFEYATKRYRSNLINWGMLPFIIEKGDLPFKNGDYLFIPDIKKAVAEKADSIKAYAVGDEIKPFNISLGELTDDERRILIAGCLINYYKE